MTKLIKRALLSLIVLSIVSNSFAQVKKTIQPADYFIWKSIEHAQISDSGTIVTHIQTVLRGNSELRINLIKANELRTFNRAKNARIHPSEEFVAFIISPDYDSVRKLKLDNIPEKKHPKDSLGIYIVKRDTLIKFPKIVSYKIAEFASPSRENWVVFLRSDDYKLKSKPTVENKPTKKKKSFFQCLFNKKPKEEPKPAETPKFSGSVLTMVNTSNLKTVNYEGVKDYLINKNGTYCLFNVSKKINDTLDSCSLLRYDFSNKKSKTIASIKGEITNINWNTDGEIITFIASSDTGQYKNYQLYLWSNTTGISELIMDTIHPKIKSHQSPSKHFSNYFSEDGKKLYFGVGKKVKNPAKDTLTKDEKYQLDVWHWNEGRIQPQQKLSQKKDENSVNNWVYDIESKNLFAIIDTSLDIIQFPHPENNSFALVSSQIPYLKEMTWDFWYYDYYLVNLNNGERKKLLTHFHGNAVKLSPSGNYLHFWNYKDSTWNLMNTNDLTTVSVTKKIPEKFYKWHHDVPEKIDPEGTVYWSKDEKHYYIEGQYNVWKFDLNNNAQNITTGNTKFQQYTVLQLDKKEVYVDDSLVIFKSFNHWNKNEGIWSYNGSYLTQILDQPSTILSVQKSKFSSAFIMRQSTVSEYPEIQYSNDFLKTRSFLTNTNPQQKEYNWASVELVSWKDYNGDSLSGLLYKPEDFDPAKKYPMIVYFYERNTQSLHRYYSPRPTASIVFPTEYASNGFLIFVPDIPYKIGKPAKSAFNAIMSGTNHLTKNFAYIDSTRMGLQGQSWGGYQTAQLITMTTKFKCAMAGAPVSNMFSAYGGIRWGSGLSRTFQYETGQSRIGKTIWEAPELYIENSPLFHLPKVHTPLLIMHNDQDGAVPWYQGIELYNGLRRLEKPVWLLNYNGDDHNLMKPANRIDLSIRMKAFFDHYLMNAPAPEWLVKGIPAVEKVNSK